MASIKTLLHGAVLGTVIALASPTVFAASLFSQAPLAGGTGVQSSLGGQIGDDFALAGDGSVRTLTWWGSSTTATGGFGIRIFDAAGASVLDCLVGVGACDGSVVPSPTALLDDAGAPVDAFVLRFNTAFRLAAGNYLLSIINDDDLWFWAASTGGEAFVRFADSDPFDPAGVSNRAFVLADDGQAVPEPGILALLGLAGLGLGLATRRRKVLNT